MQTSTAHPRTRVKMCGMTREQDIETAARAGADAIGLVFYPGSRRAVTVDRAKSLRTAVPPFVSVVTLFANSSAETVAEVIANVRPDLLQFHGDESVDFCEQFGLPYLRAFRVGAPGMDTADSLHSACRGYANAHGWLYDSYSPGYGGSGHGFDTGLLDAVIRAADHRPLIVAGGLRPETVAQCVQQLRPYAVDVSSGIESEPGIKSAEKIQKFIQAVRSA